MLSSTDTVHQNELQPSTSSTSTIFQSFVSEVRLNYKTIINACVNACGSLISTTYWIAQMTDVIVDLDGEGQDEYFADMSIVGLPIGIVLAMFITIGSVYAHYILNTNSTYAIKHRQYTLGAAETDSEIDPRVELSRVQKFLLFLDFFSHAADGAGPVLFVYSLAATDPARIDKVYAQLIGTLIGCVAAFADANTCGHNMRLHNKNVLMDALTPVDTPPDLHARFIAHELKKLQFQFASTNPLAAGFFKEASDKLTEGAFVLENQTLQRRLTMEELNHPSTPKIREITATDNDDDEEISYRLLP